MMFLLYPRIEPRGSVQSTKLDSELHMSRTRTELELRLRLETAPAPGIRGYIRRVIRIRVQPYSEVRVCGADLRSGRST